MSEATTIVVSSHPAYALRPCRIVDDKNKRGGEQQMLEVGRALEISHVDIPIVSHHGSKRKRGYLHPGVAKHFDIAKDYEAATIKSNNPAAFDPLAYVTDASSVVGTSFAGPKIMTQLDELLASEEFLGKRLAQAIDDKGFTRKQVADALGVSDTAVSQWAKGIHKPSDDKIETLATLLGVEKNWLKFGITTTANLATDRRQSDRDYAKLRVAVIRAAGGLVKARRKLRVARLRLLAEDFAAFRAIETAPFVVYEFMVRRRRAARIPLPKPDFHGGTDRFRQHVAQCLVKHGVKVDHFAPLKALRDAVQHLNVLLVEASENAAVEVKVCPTDTGIPQIDCDIKITLR